MSLRKQWKMIQVFGSLNPHGRLGWSSCSWLLTLAWSGPDLCSHLESKLVNGWSLFPRPWFSNKCKEILNKATQVWVLTSLFTCCVTQGKLLNYPKLFLLWKGLLSHRVKVYKDSVCNAPASVPDGDEVPLSTVACRRQRGSLWAKHDLTSPNPVGSRLSLL